MRPPRSARVLERLCGYRASHQGLLNFYESPFVVLGADQGRSDPQVGLLDGGHAVFNPADAGEGDSQWPPGWLDATAGSIDDPTFSRPAQVDYETREKLD